MEELPDTLDETYERILREIRKPNEGHAHRMLQCLVVAVRPLRVAELAEVLAFDFGAEGIPKLNPDWRWADHEEAIMSTCSSLVMIVGHMHESEDESNDNVRDESEDEDDHGVEDESEDGDNHGVEEMSDDENKHDDGLEDESEYEDEDESQASYEDKTQDSRIVQFSHFSVKEFLMSRIVQFSHFSIKEFLMSSRFAESSRDVSHYHVEPEAAHTILAQACLGVLLRLDDRIDRDKIKNFPLADYAARHWVKHARFKGVSSHILDGMECLLNADKPHFSAWLWIYNEDRFGHSMVTMSPEKPDAVPLYYAALFGFRDLTARLLTKYPEDVHAKGGKEVTPLHASAYRGHTDVFSLLVEHYPNLDIEGYDDQTPLHAASWNGYLEIGKLLLDRGADVNARNNIGRTPLFNAAWTGRLAFARMLLENGAMINTPDLFQSTSLHWASEAGHVEVVRLLLEHGADLRARNESGRTPSEVASQYGKLEIVQLLSQSL